MRIFLLLVLSLNCFAGYRVLVEENGNQGIINFKDSESYQQSGNAVILWDERVNKTPPVDLNLRIGGYKLENGNLVYDAVKKAQFDSDNDARVSEEVTRRTKASLRESALINCAKASDYTNAELKQCIKLLAKQLVKEKLKASDL